MAPLRAKKKVVTKRFAQTSAWLAVALLGLVAPYLYAVPEVPGPIDHRVRPPVAPRGSEAIQFIMPELVIPAGIEQMLCWVPDWVPDQDYFVTRFEGL